MNIIFKSKKPFISFIKRDKKLFIGLTTKPNYELQIRSKNNTTILIPKKIRKYFWAKKVSISRNLLLT